MSAAKLFGGQHAVPLRGCVSREGGTLIFQREDLDESYAFPMKQFRHMEKVGGILHLEFRPRKKRSSPVLLEIMDPRFKSELIEGFKISGFASVFRHVFWNRLPLVFWLGCLLAVFPLAYWGYTRGAEELSQFIPLSWEEKLGKQVYGQVTAFYPLIEDHHDQKELQAMADLLADEDSPYTLKVAVVETPEINAFALPGGQILVTSGFLKFTRDRDVWAAVLGHEVAHVEKRHVMRAITKNAGAFYLISISIGGGMEGFETAEQAVELAGVLLNMHYSRSMESEADRVSVEKLLALEKDPRGLVTFFRELQKVYGSENESLPFLSSHPMFESRIEAVEEWVPVEATYTSW